MTAETNMNEATDKQVRPAGGARPSRFVPGLALGLVLGVVLCGAGMVVALPKMMIVTAECNQGIDDTLAAVEQAARDQGWVVSGRSSLTESLAKHGVDFGRRVEQLRICQPRYAESVLTTDRHVACLMPCAMAVWEGDDGKVYLSKMNVGLMGKLFGGNLARVMGTQVAGDEARILAGILR